MTSLYAEIGKLSGRRLGFNAGFINPRTERSLFDGHQEFFDPALFSFGYCLHCVVTDIADPTFQTQAMRLYFHKGAVSHALNPACDPDMNPSNRLRLSHGAALELFLDRWSMHLQRKNPGIHLAEVRKTNKGVRVSGLRMVLIKMIAVTSGGSSLYSEARMVVITAGGMEAWITLA